jgi:hypothetical protein
VDVEMPEQPSLALNEPKVFIGKCRRSHAGQIGKDLGTVTPMRRRI